MLTLKVYAVMQNGFNGKKNNKFIETSVVVLVLVTLAFVH